MKSLRSRLQEARKTLGVPWEILERDYLLSWVLAGINRVEPLRDSLIFKGGTALKKCWFGDYRFSEDLDFSGVGGVPIGSAMEDAVKESCRIAAQLLDEYAPIEITCERYTEKDPHPGGQEAFSVRAKFPWHKDPHTRVMVEVSMDEKVIGATPRRTVIHGYGEPLDAKVRTYSLEEIVAEKLRAILQHVEKLEERGWSRSRARDYYDLWRIFKTYGHRMTLTDFPQFLQEKCAVRNVSFQGADDFFDPTMLAYVGKTWEQWLGPLVPALPPCTTVIGELRPQLGALLSDQA
jgi:predicted nucleotidyltransferase component of viral defense system